MPDLETRRRNACQKAFQGFRPDFSRCRDKTLARTILELAKDGQTSAQIAAATGKTPKAIQKFFRRYDFPNLHNIEPRRRDEQPMWKGGVKIVKGYAYERRPDHPHGSKHGSYVAVHRLVMEAKIGRYLRPGEVVDHIDGDRLNNDPSNLRLFPTNGAHLRATLTGRKKNFSEEGRRRISEAVSQSNRRRKGMKLRSSRDG